MSEKPYRPDLSEAVAATLAALTLGDEDAAAKKLAKKYADVIDQHDDPAWAMRWIGPLLLDALESLGATPLARQRLKGAKTPDAAPNRLQALRQARRA